MSEDDADEIDRMRSALHQRGVYPHHPDAIPPHVNTKRYPNLTMHGVYPYWRTELGHQALVMPGDNGWHLTLRHHGDPTGTMIRGDLGHDPEEAADNAARVFTSRDVMGHLRDMYHRAYLNNDPTGLDEEARRERPPRHAPEIWLN